MKKILLASSALAMLAGAAAAEANVGGYGYAGVTHDGTNTDVLHAMRVTFSGSVNTDSGVNLTASSRITITDNNDNGQLGHNKITMSAGGLTVAAGATHGAMKTLARNATFLGFNDGGTLYLAGGTGVDNNTSGLNDSGNNVLITYTTGGFTVGVASDVAGTEADIGVKYASGAWSIGAGFSDADEWMVAGSYSTGDLSIGVGANSDDEFTLTAGYQISAATSLKFGYDSSDVYGLEVSHDIGGANLVGAVGQVAGTTVASAGVFFSF